MSTTRALMRSLRLGWRPRHLCTHASSERDHQRAHGEKSAKLILSIRSSILEERELFRRLLAEKDARIANKEAMIADRRQARDNQIQAIQALLNQLRESKDQILKFKDEGLNEMRRLLKLKEEKAAASLLEVLNVKRNNNTHGLFERFQDQLKAKLPMGCDELKGRILWEKILECNANLAACVGGHTRTWVDDHEKLADFCYEIYSKLSEHIHAGRRLKPLQVAIRGTIIFNRQLLTAQQGEILGCIGKECGYVLEEYDYM